MRWPALIVALVAGCGTSAVRVDGPPLAGAKALVLAVHQGGTVTLEALAIDGDPPAFTFDVRELGEYDVYALVYAESLSELGLEPGTLEVVTDEPQRALDPAMHELAVTKDDAGLPAGWGAVDARPSWLDRARVRGTPSPCRRFGAQTLKVLPTPGARHNWGFAARTRDVVIAGTDQGEIFEISGDTSVRRLSGPTEALHATAGVADAVGGIWIADVFGRLWHGQLADEPSTWALVSTLSPLFGVDFMDVADDGSEVVAMARDGAIGVFSNGAWRVVHRIQTERDGTAQKGGVVRLGPDDFLVASPFSRTVDHVVGSQVTPEMLPAMSGLTAIRRLPGVGVVAGSGSGELFVRRGTRWEALPPSGSTFWVLSIAAFGDGFLFGAPYGGLGQFSPTDHACPLGSPVAFTIRYLVPLGAGLVCLGESLGDPAPRGVILTPR